MRTTSNRKHNHGSLCMKRCTSGWFKGFSSFRLASAIALAALAFSSAICKTDQHCQLWCDLGHDQERDV